MVVLLAACGGASGVALETTEAPVATGAPDVTPTVAGAESTTTDTSESTATTSSGRPVAPDFTLELNDGGTYTLSDSENPVYLVFWAEW